MGKHDDGDRPVILFLLSALFLRLIGFTSSAIWYDEVHSLFRATHPLTYFNLWEISLRPFAHGPLWLLRLPALICAMASLWLAWLIMDELKFENSQRVIACIFLAAFPGLIWMSQDARYYAMITLAGTATIYLALRHHWTFGLVFGLLYFIHPTAPAYGLAAFLVALITGIERRSFLIATGAALLTHLTMTGLISLIPTVPFTEGMCCQGHTQGWWLGPMTMPFSAFSLVQAFFVNTLSAWWMMAALLWLGVMILYAILSPRQIPALMVSIPFSAIVIVSLTYQNVFFYRPLMPLALPLSLWIGYMRDRLMFAPFMLVLLIVGLIGYDPADRGAYADLAAARIREAWQPGDRIMYEDGLTAAPFDYYLHDLPACMLSEELLPQGYPLALCTSKATGREWLIISTSTRDDAILFDHLWPWQVTPIEVYLVKTK